MNFLRQLDILDPKKIEEKSITLIGVGAIGSFTALTLTKMGVKDLEVYDKDGVAEHNLPNQFYREKDIRQFKVDSLQEILQEFNGITIKCKKRLYTNQKLKETVIIATDSMLSRQIIWKEFLKQEQCLNYIEARMGAEQGMVYVIRKIGILRGDAKGIHMLSAVHPKDIKFYEEMLYPKKEIKPLPCTAKAIIYNILMISSIICRAYKSIVSNEEFHREIIFDMKNMDYMKRK